VEKDKKENSQKYAGFWVRFLAVIIDGLLLGLVLGPILALIFPTSPFLSPSESLSYSFNTSYYLRTLLGWAYYVAMTTIYGATVGKMALGLKVVRDDGTKLDVWTVILREIIGKFISAITLLIGYIIAGFDSKKQALHDKIAKTYVIYNK